MAALCVQRARAHMMQVIRSHRGSSLCILITVAVTPVWNYATPHDNVFGCVAWFLLIRLAHAQTGPPFVGSVCDTPPHTPYHSVSEFPSDIIAMNPEEQLAMPDIKKARPVMLQRMMSVELGIEHARTRDKSPQPSGSENVSHGSGVSPPSKKRFMRSLLADPMPALASADQSAVPDHEAFMDISLGFKSNVMRLRNWFGKVVIEFSPSPAIDGYRLNRDEYALIVAAIETVDHYMSSKDTSDSDIGLWILPKDWTITSGKKNIAYLTVKPYRGQLYTDLRDYWQPNGPEGGLARTQRGITLNLMGWNTFKEQMDNIEEMWVDAEDHLGACRVKKTENIFEVDSQPVTLDWSWAMGKMNILMI